VKGGTKVDLTLRSVLLNEPEDNALSLLGCHAPGFDADCPNIVVLLGEDYGIC